MPTSAYRARLRGNVLEWLDSVPEEAQNGEGVEVEVVLPTKPWRPDKERGARMRDALEAIARLPAHSFPEDVLEWQREIRKDRPLPGRETE